MLSSPALGKNPLQRHREESASARPGLRAKCARAGAHASARVPCARPHGASAAGAVPAGFPQGLKEADPGAPRAAEPRQVEAHEGALPREGAAGRPARERLGWEGAGYAAAPTKRPARLNKRDTAGGWRTARASRALMFARKPRGGGPPPAPGRRPAPPAPLTFGWVPIQASSGAQEGAPPPPPPPPGPSPLQPGVGSEPPRSSMPGRAARRWCTTPRARPAAGARASAFRPPPGARRVRRLGAEREELLPLAIAAGARADGALQLRVRVLKPGQVPGPEKVQGGLQPRSPSSSLHACCLQPCGGKWEGP